ncbi:hypothetical protein C6I20_04685 [Aeromicrobium sp. A1-2]|nr:hypothetical protein C6I20_04685 [Aeromicrobium sp. A1-2]
MSWIAAGDVGQGLLTDLIADFSGTPAAHVRVVRACRSCGSDRHGKPQIVLPHGHTPLHLSLSRSAGAAVVAVTDAGPIGIDVEQGSSDLVTWVRKESLVKATGHGLTIDPETITVSEPGLPPELLSWPEPQPIDRAVWMFDLVSPDGFVGAVSILANDRPCLVTRPAAPAV